MYQLRSIPHNIGNDIYIFDKLETQGKRQNWDISDSPESGGGERMFCWRDLYDEIFENFHYETQTLFFEEETVFYAYWTGTWIIIALGTH